MAQRRMFTLQIVDSDAFLDMPQSSQLLYFHLAMRADDDGFVGNPKKIMRVVGTNEDDLKVLLTKRFLLAFENGVVVIKHWRMHNYIQSDRYKETQYLELKNGLTVKDNGAYTERIQDVSKMDTQVRLELGKDRLGKKAADAAPLKEMFKFSNEDLELAQLLVERITANTPTFKAPNVPQWAEQVRLMRERDSRTIEQIRFLIDWCQKDHFWQANILSTKKLREKFDVLVAQVKRSKTSKSDIQEIISSR